MLFRKSGIFRICLIADFVVRIDLILPHFPSASKTYGYNDQALYWTLCVPSEAWLN